MSSVPDTLHALDDQDCWNRIGVAGDMSCPKLEQHVHCRNCEVYAGAAKRSMQRPVDAAYREDWAALLRQPQAARAQHDSSGLVFRLGREWLMLPTRIVASVAPLAASHSLPHRSGGGLTGIVNVGGTLAPCIALATLLGIDENDAPQQGGRHVFARLLVINWEEQCFALPVADLHGILRYGATSVGAPAATLNKGLQRFITGVLTHGEMRIGVLDAPLIGHQLTRLLR
ncbi:chemotaxis protein CheW [Massilia sp. CCM 8733]|uniref:Chemotaxis protein CheW n=1 Tax=Massilia mucilaginosa TaxID=2609282 RepID=A0ABX0NQZ5_9BURK|nr:chemotaxis protein CheW [Massilia mucilaginosa]NHZ89130.1 chemotaxis protein CheW [Massilia mucilaginosa]